MVAERCRGYLKCDHATYKSFLKVSDVYSNRLMCERENGREGKEREKGEERKAGKKEKGG